MLYSITYTWNLKKKTHTQRNYITRQKHLHRYRKELIVTRGEREEGRVKLMEFESTNYYAQNR